MKQKIKRTLALLLAILIFSGSLPVTALATSDGSSPAAITESIAQEPATDPPQGIAPEESAPPLSSTDTGGDAAPPASSLAPESGPTKEYYHSHNKINRYKMRAIFHSPAKQPVIGCLAITPPVIMILPHRHRRKQ